MLSLLLTTATAQADTLDITLDLPANGVTRTWQLEDVQEGRVVEEKIDLSRRSHIEVAIDYQKLEGNQVMFELAVTQVSRIWLGREKREVVTRPRITTIDGKAASLMQGAREPIPDTEPVEYRQVSGVAVKLVPRLEG